MKRTIWVASVCVIAALSRTASGQSQSPIPWTNSFENGYNGKSITNSDFGFWRGDGTAYVTNNANYSTNNFAYYPNFPMTNATHSNAMYFTDASAGLSNAIDGSSAPMVWVDTMIQPARSETLPLDANVTNSQVALCFDTNGYLNIYHGLAVTGEGVGSHTNGWTALTNGFGRVSTGQWVRLTVLMSYYNPLAYDDMVMFKVLINGQEFSDASGYSTNSISAGDGSTQPGPWFVAATWNNSQLNQLVFEGSGMLDDLVVDSNPVFFGSNTSASVTILSLVSSGKGSISPAGTLTSASPAAASYNITPSNYWYIANVYTGAVNGSSGTVASAQGVTNVFNLALTNITVNYFVSASFLPQTVAGSPYRTPLEWLAQYGCVSTNADTGDTDGDGLLDGQEYVAGTIPNNSNSVVKVLSETVTGGVVNLQWLGAAGANINGRLYVLAGATNLVSTNTWPVLTNLTLGVSGTNMTTISSPGTTPFFYKIVVTNDPPAWP